MLRSQNLFNSAPAPAPLFPLFCLRLQLQPYTAGADEKLLGSATLPVRYYQVNMVIVLEIDVYGRIGPVPVSVLFRFGFYIYGTKSV